MRILRPDPESTERPVSWIPSTNSTGRWSCSIMAFPLQAIVVELHVIILMLACYDEWERELALERKRVPNIDRVAERILGWINIRLADICLVVVVHRDYSEQVLAIVRTILPLVKVEGAGS